MSKWERSNGSTKKAPAELAPDPFAGERTQDEVIAAARDHARRAARERLPLGQRLDRVIGALTMVSTVPAAPIGRGRGGESERIGPPEAPQPEGVERELRIARYAIQQLEAILDAECVGRDAVAAKMRGAEKDRVIWEHFEGVPSREVCRIAPYLGGSARTIERAREREAKLRGLRCRLTTGEVTGVRALAEAA